MANTRLIKRRIISAKNIAKITSAMEMVAASKMKKAQDQALLSRPYAKALEKSLQKVAQTVNPNLHPLLLAHTLGDQILVIVSTNKGLCGGMNTNLMKATLEWKKSHQNGKVIAVGKKAVTFSRLLGVEILAQFTDMPEKVSLVDILPIISLIKDKFLSSQFKSVDILYTDFINTLSQSVAITHLLPIFDPEVLKQTQENKVVVKSEYLFEPSAKKLLDQLLPYYLENSLYQIMLESRASEHSARMVAMKNASENADELTDELQLLFNKSRQASITNELLDITTATLTLEL